MDPRHPELSVKRIRDLMSQYNQVEHDMGKAMTSAELAKLEREGGLVVQEICLTAPRMHEALIQTSRMRRRDLSRGVVEKPVEKSIHRTDVVFDIENPYGEIAVHDAKPEEYIEKPKKKVTKKKNTKKAEK